MIVQVFDEFSIDVEILFNYLVFVLCTLSCSSLRGVLAYVFLVVFHLLVSSELDSYVVYAPP
jgi:hypothetical protein